MNKQIRFTTESLSPLYKMSVGFDRLAEQFFNDPTFTNNATGYPPFNISKGKDDVYEITLAVAGFKKDDIEIETHNGQLVVAGRIHRDENDNRKFLHRGIAERAFERRFNLAEHVVVNGAQLENGLLHIDMVREIPEEKKPRKISIASGSPKTIEGKAA